MNIPPMLFVLVVIVALAVAYCIGQIDGYWRRASEDRAFRADILERYRLAVDDLDRWCGHSSPHARLIAAHLRAVGEGHELNAGTPHAQEPCVVSGLRDQLARLNA